jgi:hypothetical protein
MACKAILLGLEDAGLTVAELDGFAIYSNSCDPAEVAQTLGVPEVRFAATLTSGGGGAAGSLGLAAAAIVSGQAEVCVSLMTLQQVARRLGGTAVDGGGAGGGESPIRTEPPRAPHRRVHHGLGADLSRAQLLDADPPPHAPVRHPA